MDLFKGFHRKQNHNAKHRKYEKARKNSFPDLFSMFKSEAKQSVDDDVSVERINHLDVQANTNGHFNVTIPENSSRHVDKIMNDEEENVSKVDTFNAQIKDHQQLAKELTEAGSLEDAEKEKEMAEELIQQRDLLIKKNSSSDEQLNEVLAPLKDNPDKPQVEEEDTHQAEEEGLSSVNEPQAQSDTHQSIKEQLNDDHFNEIWENRDSILKNAFVKVQQEFSNRPNASQNEIKEFVLQQIPEELKPIIEQTFKQASAMTPEQQRQQILKAQQLNKSKEEKIQESRDDTMDNNQNENKSSEVNVFGMNSNNENNRPLSSDESTSTPDSSVPVSDPTPDANPSYDMNNNQPEASNKSVISSVKGLIKDNVFNEESTLVINNRVLKTLQAIKINPDRILLAYKNGTVKSIGPASDDLTTNVDFVLISDYRQFVSDLKAMLINSDLVDSDFLVPNRFNIK